ncbi:MAG: O-antigen ligase family protein [Patescibacteria group bacterium]|jgi:hypothetical protein
MIPRLILTLLPLILPLYVVRFRIGPLPTTLLEVALIILFSVWLSSRLRLSSLRRQGSSLDRLGWVPAFAGMTKNEWFWPLGLWLLAGLISVFVAENHVAAFGLWRAYFLEPAIIFMMLSDLLKTDDDKRAILRSICAVLAIITAWAILQMAGLLPIPSPWNVAPQGLRATGPFPFPNALALFAVPLAALCFHFALKDKPLLNRAALFAAFGCGLVAAALAKSDGGLIALAAAAFISLVIKKETRRYAIIAAILGTIVIAVIPTTRDIATKQLFFKEWSGKVRLVMWGETKTMLFDRPIQGAGLGNFPNAIKPYHKATWMEIFQYPHNILLNLWSETGLLGVLAFGWILVTWIRHGRFDALPIITVILVHGLVDVPYFKNDLAIAFWMMIILTTHPLPKRTS